MTTHSLLSPHPWYAGKRVVVTGGGGFIGSHLVEALLQAGAHVTALIKYNSSNHWGHLEALPEALKAHLSVVLGDVADPYLLGPVVKEANVVFHLAALIGIPYSYLAPQHYVQTNVQGTLNVLEACRNHGVGRLIHTSTSEVYGTAQYTPMEETHPLNAQSPYAATKVAADQLVQSYHTSFALPTTIVRPFNTYGPRQSARAFIPTVISQALTQPHVAVGHLAPQRDLLFVADTVQGFLAAGACPAAVGHTVHLGTGTTHSMQAVLHTVLRLCGKEALPVQAEAPERVRPEASEVDVLLCHPAKAKALLGWEATVGLEEGLRQTIAAFEATLMSTNHSYKPQRYAI